MTWSLTKKDGTLLEPLQFSNGKTQETVTQEVLDAIEQGHKIIFIKGVCGSGKSAIALHVGKALGRASIVVPVKYLQEQYTHDYTNNLTIQKDDGTPLNIQHLTGRNNFGCTYTNNTQADDRYLPCTIELRKENWDLIKAYLKHNKAVSREDFGTIDDVRRISVAAACKSWSPVIGKEWFGDYGLRDAKQHTYKGLGNKDFIFFQRERNCAYYEQFLSYINADVLIFNSRKYEIETALDRKPATDVEIIDECDEFLDSLSNEKRMNLHFLRKKLSELSTKAQETAEQEALFALMNILDTILQAKWINDMIQQEEIIPLQETAIAKFFTTLLRNDFLLEHEELESFFATAKDFEGHHSDTYVNFDYSQREDVIARVVNVNLEKKLESIVDKNKVFVMMSGTLHSPEVLKNVFGLKDFVIIDAEVNHGGTIRRNITGREKSCRWRDFQEGSITREEYLLNLQDSIHLAKKPVLVHVNSYADLPTEEEKTLYNISIMSKEKLQTLQQKYKKGELLQMFKDKQLDVLYSTKCNRGVDLPGDQCHSIVFTKYPFPGMKDIFWQVLQKKDANAFRTFYFDKARREFIQRIYRGLRNNDDIINLLSPDLKVLQAAV